jgi:nucleoside-diphosphate-sugar epimerase
MAEPIAITGATGFIGRHLARTLAASGHRVRALVRRDEPTLTELGIEQWRGDLGADLEGFVAGCPAIVHVAGAVRARDARHFHDVNAGGAARLAAAAGTGTRFVLISSLAARHPQVSAYAASKAAGERRVLEHAQRLTVTVIRPPAVYGPEDRATLPLLRGLSRGLLIHPAAPDARFSLLYAHDLVALTGCVLAEPPPSGTIIEPDDGMPGGYGWASLAALAGERLGRRVRRVGIPPAPLGLAAWLAERQGRWSGQPPILSRGKVAELYHRDWVSDTRAAATVAGWRPEVRFGDGLVASLAWYREAGWL